MTKNQASFKKEISRLRDGLRKAVKRGYLPDYSLIPEIPKRVTKKALEEIKKLKPRNIYIKGDWVDFTTGEVITAHEHVYKTKKDSNKIIKAPEKGGHGGKPINENDIMGGVDVSFTIIQNLREEIHDILPPRYQQIMYIWLDLMIAKFGEDDTAEALQRIAKSFRRWMDESTLPSFQAIFTYQDAFFEEIAKILGPQGKQWLDDTREELNYMYAEQGYQILD